MEEAHEVTDGDEEQHSEGDTEPRIPEISVLVSKKDHVPTPKLKGGLQQEQESS